MKVRLELFGDQLEKIKEYVLRGEILPVKYYQETLSMI